MSAVKLSSGGGESASESVTAVDQGKINRFARLNNRLEDLKAEMAKLATETQNLGDAGDELMLADDADAAVPLKIGDTFVEFSPDQLQDKLESLKEAREKERADRQAAAAAVRDEMAKLKVELYAKFGSAINLEADDAE